MYKIASAFLITIIALAAILQPIAAQETTDPPVYIVQSGDTLGAIANLFGVAINDIISANDLADPNALAVGMQLIIPGLEGIQGTLSTSIIPLGDNLRTVARQYQLTETGIAKANRITSPAEVYAGTSLLLPVQSPEEQFAEFASIEEGLSIFEIALVHDANPWSIIDQNQSRGSWDAIQGEVLFAPPNTVQQGFHAISQLIQSVEISPLPLVQGTTTVVTITTTEPLTLHGSLAGYELNFVSLEENKYAAIQGIHARQAPGMTPFTLTGSNNAASDLNFSQMVLIEQGQFGRDIPLIVDPSLIDPAITEPEEEFVRTITGSFSSDKYWNGLFTPLTDEPCINAGYGNSRSYNGSPYTYFHTGVDFGVCAQNLNIYAPAPGYVVYAGPLNVRGNATILYHGLGIYSGIWHQSQILVSEGDYVEQRQLVGIIGNTGRSTGPHLHWEIWANGVQIEPLAWFQKNFP